MHRLSSEQWEQHHKRSTSYHRSDWLRCRLHPRWIHTRWSCDPAWNAIRCSRAYRVSFFWSSEIMKIRRFFPLERTTASPFCRDIAVRSRGFPSRKLSEWPGWAVRFSWPLPHPARKSFRIRRKSNISLEIPPILCYTNQCDERNAVFKKAIPQNRRAEKASQSEGEKAINRNFPRAYLELRSMACRI